MVRGVLVHEDGATEVVELDATDYRQVQHLIGGPMEMRKAIALQRYAKAEMYVDEEAWLKEGTQPNLTATVLSLDSGHMGPVGGKALLLGEVDDEGNVTELEQADHLAGCVCPLVTRLVAGP